MSQNTPAPTQHIFPFLRYQDAPAALRWLASTFGFQQTLLVKGPDDTIAHAEMRFGSASIWIGTIRRDQPFPMKTPKELGAVGQGLYVYVRDVDAHYERAKAAGANIVVDIHDTPHGSRDYIVHDPEGYLWSFGTYMPAQAG